MLVEDEPTNGGQSQLTAYRLGRCRLLPGGMSQCICTERQAHVYECVLRTSTRRMHRREGDHVWATPRGRAPASNYAITYA